MATGKCVLERYLLATMDVPRFTCYGVYISQLIRLAKASSLVTVFSVVKLIGLLFNSNPRSICPACLEDFDPLVGHIILRCESNAMILGSFDTVPDVQHLENKDSFYMIVAGFLHRLLREVHGDAL